MVKCDECGWTSSHSDRCLNCGNTKNGIELFSFEGLFLEKLKDLCLEYDYINGIYPQRYYYGKAIYELYLDNNTNKAGNKQTLNEWAKEAYKKFAKNKGEL